jgi:hypothetical protein
VRLDTKIKGRSHGLKRKVNFFSLSSLAFIALMILLLSDLLFFYIEKLEQIFIDLKMTLVLDGCTLIET